MNIVEESFKGIYPGEHMPYVARLNYSGRFSDYNANVRLRGSYMTFSLSRKWEGVSREIQIGMIQELLVKLLKKKPATTIYIDLYNSFVKNIHIAIPKTETHPVLEESFSRVNERYFFGQIEKPNLRWGSGTTTLGTYNFKTDRITISRALAEDTQLMDYVMYHEILHKLRKFERKGIKTRYHDAKFRKLEKVFENREEIEARLKRIPKKRPKNTIKKIFKAFFN